MTPPILQNAYDATGTGSWCMARTSERNAVAARREVWKWLARQGLGTSRIGRITGHDHSSVYSAIRSESRPFVCPKESFANAMRHVDERAFMRNCFGRLFKTSELIEARHEVWRRMLEDGCSFPEIAKACGMNGHGAVRDAMCAQCGLGRNSPKPSPVALVEGSCRHDQGVKSHQRGTVAAGNGQGS